MTEQKDTHLYLRVPRSDKAPYGLLVADEKPLFRKPTLLCCGGMNVTHEYPDKANGFAKRGLALLNCIGTNGHSGFQTATVTYAPECSENTARFFNQGQMPAEMFHEFVDQQLVPLLKDEHGQKLDVQQAKKNFRNINVMAHSFGGVFMQQVGSVLVDRMQKLGFSQNEIDQITGQVLVVTGGSGANYLKGKAKFTYVHIAQQHDQTMGENSHNISLIQSLLSELPKMPEALRKAGSVAAFSCEMGDSPWDIRQTPDSREMIVTTVSETPPNPERLVLDDSKQYNGNGKINNDSLMPYQTQDELNHGNDVYYNVAYDEYGIILRTMASSVLSNGLNNSIQNENDPAVMHELANPRELVHIPEERKFLTDEEVDFCRLGKTIGYGARINEMLNPGMVFDAEHPNQGVSFTR